jgi:hypothetical protein
LAGSTRKIVFGSLIANSLLSQWSGIKVWMSPDTLPSDWPLDDPHIPAALGSWPVWLEAVYLGTAGAAPSTIDLHDDNGNYVDTIAISAAWFYDPNGQSPAPYVPPPPMPGPVAPPAVPPPAPFTPTPGYPAPHQTETPTPTAPPAVVAMTPGPIVAMVAGAVALAAGVVAWVKWGRR